MSTHSRFRNTVDMMKRMPAACKKHVAFLKRVSDSKYVVEQMAAESAPYYFGQTYRVNAGNYMAWDTNPGLDPQFVFNTDGFRIHVVMMPLAEAEARDNIVPWGGRPDVNRLITEWGDDTGETIAINPDYLREAVHPDAEQVHITLSKGNPKEGPLVITSYRGGAQIAFAMIMPLNLYNGEKGSPILPEFAEGGWG